MKSKVKYILLLALVLMLSFSLSACGQKTEKAKEEQKSEEVKEENKDKAEEKEEVKEEENEEKSEDKYRETVTIKHKYGETEFPVNPKVSLAERATVDDFLVLGIKPTYAILLGDEAEVSWRKDKLDGVTILGFDEASDFEKLASLRPDLVVPGEWSVMTEEGYEKLSNLGPTLGLSPDEDIDHKEPWIYRVEALGKIYQVEDKANDVIDSHYKRINEIKSSMPYIEGKTFLSGRWDDGSKTLNVTIDPTNFTYRTMTELGFVQYQEFIDKYMPEAEGIGAFARISAENIKDIDADLIHIVAFNPEAYDEIKSIPGFEDLKAYKNGTIYFDKEGMMFRALDKTTSLNEERLINEFIPYFEKLK